MTLNESYDANEQRSTEQKTGTPDPTFSYVYDSLNRVTGVTITPDVGSATTTSYQFDGANNFVQQSAGGTTTNYNSMAGAYAPDLLNRYLSIQTISGTTTTTDARMSAPRRTRPRRPCRTPAAFDAFHRLVTVNTQPSGSLQAGSGCYLYDATGRRVARFAHLPNGAQVQSVIVWDGPQEIEEYGSAPTSAPTARYVYGAADVDELVEFEPNPLAQGHPVYYYQQDLQESILGLTDSSGNVVEQYSYTSIYGVHAVSTPGGNPEPIEGAIGNPFRFQGHRLDPESGLIFFRNRYLDPVEGRFVNRDPIGIWGDPSASGNGYAFCGGNPVNRRDPFGLDDNVDPQDQNAWGGNNGGHWEIHIQWNFFGNYIKNVTVGGFIGAYECGKKALQGDPIGAGVDMGKGIVLMPVNWYNAMNNASTQTKAGNYDEANRQAATAASIAATPAVMIFTPRIVGYLKGQAISVISKASQAWETLDFGCKGQLLALAGTGEAFVNAVARGDEAVGGGMVMRPAGKTVTGVAVLNGVMQMAGEGRDLITTGRQTHILSGDQTGGGHRPGTGIPGKSEFPAGWTDDQILDTITDIATDPASTRTPSFGGRTVVTGTRNGIDIRVIVDANGNVVSGYPTNVPRNP
jgi:RHS repeat-associated protein